MKTLTDSAINTLVLYADYTTRLSYYDDWLEAFCQSPQFHTQSLNICERRAAKRIAGLIAGAELTVLLHSTNGDTTAYLEPFVPILADRKGKLLSFVGNEVNLPGSPISAKRRVLKAIHPDYVATQLLQEAGEYLFGDLVVEKVLAIPHALNPQAFQPLIPPEQRGIDIGVRAVRYLPHLGDNDRNRLLAFFETHLFAPDLIVDISTRRLDRRGWAAFLNNCRGTVSSEAGSWYIERDDATMETIRRWTAGKHGHQTLMIPNDSPLRKLGHKLPWWMRVVVRKMLRYGPLRHESAITESLSFDEIYALFFKGQSRAPVYGKCISSRHFDAIGTRTCQVLLEGRYNDVLHPAEHYIALKPDFSNTEEVMEKFMDSAERDKITQRAYEHVREHHTHANRLTYIYDTVSV